MQKAKIGKSVIYKTDGRNGLSYDLPAIINCTQDTHPGDYPNGKNNPLPVPESDTHVHLTVFTPGGFGSIVVAEDDMVGDEAFVGAETFTPGSGTYVEWNVPQGTEPGMWRWPVID